MSKRIIFGLILLLGLPALALAQGTPPTPTTVGKMDGDLRCYADLGITSADLVPPPPDTVITTSDAGGTLMLGPAITYYICIATRYISVIAVFIIIIVGIMYMLGGIKPETSSIAKTIIVTTLTGLVFMYLTSFIINLLVIGGILGRAT